MESSHSPALPRPPVPCVPKCHLHMDLNPFRHGDSTPVLFCPQVLPFWPRSLQSCRRPPSRARSKWSSSPSVIISPHARGSWCLQNLCPSRSQIPHKENNSCDLPAQARRQLKPNQALCPQNSLGIEVCTGFRANGSLLSVLNSFSFTPPLPRCP